MDKVFNQCMEYIEERFAQFPDKRVGKNTFIKMKDIGLSAFSVFFTQCRSFLEHQRIMQSRKGQSNAGSLFKIEHIPSDNHIRDILDEVAPTEVFPIYHRFFDILKDSGKLDQFRHFDGQLLVPLDGIHYFSSKEIFCDNCNHKAHKDGTKTYFHQCISAVIAHPDLNHVIPLIPEFIEPQDGHSKQDCERAAAKRWLNYSGKTYAALGVTLLGDDLYCCEPICRIAIENGFHFIFTCKETSHPCLYEWLETIVLGDGIHEVQQRVGTTRDVQIWRCRYVNEVPLREGSDALKVNWCEVKVFNKQEECIYYNTFATDHIITADNVLDLVKGGRTRWKVENEHNNTLKNHSYHLEHNFGHGKKHLSSLLASLNFLAFFLHSLLDLTDKQYHKLGSRLPRYFFFQQMRTLLIYMYFVSWWALLELILSSTQRAPPRSKRRKKI